MLNPGTPATSVSTNLAQATSPVHMGMVGYLSGDVDGSFAGLTTAQDLDVMQPGYFVDLVGSYTGLSAAQFGVYA